MSYEFEHSVESPVGRDFAWRFWTEVGNWPAVDPSVEWVKLEGPFADGTRGTTKPRGFDPTDWTLSEVREGRAATIEVPIEGGVMKFSWAFEDAAGGRTRITQRVRLEGERADDYLGVMKEFEEGIPAGMQSLARAMADAAGQAAES